MKKQIFTLSALALVATSAHAYTLINNKETGTKVDFTGSARLKWESSASQVTKNGITTKEHINHAIANNGSRFGFKVSQKLGNDFYALGRIEWRFRGTSSSQHDFDDIYTRQLYAGLGNKKYGELTYGHMSVITDNVKQTDLGNTLSLSDGLLTGSARKVAQYTYEGVENLTLGGFYGNGSKRDTKGKDLSNKREDTFGLAAIYKYKIDDSQSIKFGTGVSRERAENRDRSTQSYTAYSFGTAYTFGQTTVGIDLERSSTDHNKAAGNKRKQNEIRTVLEQKFTKDWRGYVMYAKKDNQYSPVGRESVKQRRNEYMVGTEYFFIPKYVKGFVEYASLHTKNAKNVKGAKVRDNIFVVGLRASW